MYGNPKFLGCRERGLQRDFENQTNIITIYINIVDVGVKGKLNIGMRGVKGTAQGHNSDT